MNKKNLISSFIPSYSQNAVLQLIAASGVGFIMFNFTRVLLLVFGHNAIQALTMTLPYIALPKVEAFPHYFWTLLTYGWAHMGFWEWLSNMFWLYFFGNVVQSLIGYKQVVPVFIYCLLLGGITYLSCQLIPGSYFQANNYLMGAQAGVMGMAVAAISIAPKYRYYLGDRLSIPIWGAVVIYIILNLAVYIPTQIPMLFLALGGALAGFIYIRILQAGYRPGEWVYDVFAGLERSVTPDERKAWKQHQKKRNQILSNIYKPKQGITQERIDAILDKINQKGYDSLTEEDKDTLYQVSKKTDK